MTQHNCPKCGDILAEDAPGGICPKCLLAAGMASTGFGEMGKPDADGLEPELALEAIRRDFPALEVIELIGRGGMGVVYKARQPALDRMVALKVLSPRFKGDPAFAERFVREARALARLNHQSIVALYDFGQSGERYYLLMEYVDGISLRQAMREGRFSPEEALAIVPHICDALQYAHDEGIVHRDIKPENVLIDKRGRVKIADFGLAKLLVPSRDDFTLTGTREVMGTPHYMAPEQMEHPAQVDHRADIYALGVVFYEMLTGELPLGRFATPSQKVHVDVRLDEVVLRTLEREPERRYQKASDVKTDIQTITCGAGEGARPPRAAMAAQTRAVSVEQRDRVQREMRLPAVGMLVGALVDVAFLLPLVGLMIFLDPLAESWRCNHGSLSRFLISVTTELGRVLGNMVMVPLPLLVPLADFADRSAASDPLALIACLGSVLAWFVVAGLGMALGARRMLGLKLHKSAILACWLAIVPIHPGAAISFWFGIIGLLRLTKPGVAEAFTNAQPENTGPQSPGFLRRNLKAVLAVTLLLAAIVMLLLASFYRVGQPYLSLDGGYTTADGATEDLNVAKAACDRILADTGLSLPQPRSVDPLGNFLINGDFENGLDGWVNRSTSHAATSLDRDVACAGTSSARIEIQTESPGSVGALQQTINATARFESVRLTGWYRYRDADKVLVHLRTLDGAQSSSILITTRTLEWTHFKVDFRLKPSSGGFRVTLCVVGSGAAWFDDVRLEVPFPDKTSIDTEIATHETIARRLASTPAAPRAPDSEGNLLLNGGFEDPYTWESVPGWQTSCGSNSSNVPAAVDSEMAHTGRASAKMDRTQFHNPYFAYAMHQAVQTTGVVTSARLRGWLRAENARRIFVDVRGLDGSREAKTRQFTGGMNWTPFTVDLALNGSTRLGVVVSLVGGGKVWFDDLKLELADAKQTAPIAEVASTTPESKP